MNDLVEEMSIKDMETVDGGGWFSLARKFIELTGIADDLNDFCGGFSACGNSRHYK